jgi:hypothetical protein
MADWISYIVDGVVDEAPQLVLLVVAFAFVTTVLMALFMAFEYVFRRLTGTALLHGFFGRDINVLDQMVDEIATLERQRKDDEELARTGDDVEFGERLHQDDNKIAYLSNRTYDQVNLPSHSQVKSNLQAIQNCVDSKATASHAQTADATNCGLRERGATSLLASWRV